MNTYRITAILKMTIDVDAIDDDEAWDVAEKAELSEWKHLNFDLYDCENLGVVDYLDREYMEY